jgi:hypothetical protein
MLGEIDVGKKQKERQRINGFIIYGNEMKEKEIDFWSKKKTGKEDARKEKLKQYMKTCSNT